MKKISFAGPSITQKEIDYVIDATRNGFYENYITHTRKLEAKLAEYLEVKYVIATHCCTHALHLAALSLGLGEGDEVIVTDFSWVATAHSIAYTGAKCVFVDIDKDSWCIDPEAIKAGITDKTKAIMLVHSFGQTAEMDKIMDIANEYNLSVIEDAAPALGSKYKGKKVGTFGDIGCFSFQGAKLTVSGEGGAFVTNDEVLYNKALLLSSMGRTDSNGVFWSDYIGYQYTIANLTAALALAQVERIDELISIKRSIFDRYEKNLNAISGIKIIKEKKDCFSNYCYPSILLEESILTERDFILAELRKNNIHCRPAFPQMSSFPMYESRHNNNVAELVGRRGISLSSAAELTMDDIDFVSECLIKLITYK